MDLDNFFVDKRNLYVNCNKRRAECSPIHSTVACTTSMERCLGVYSPLSQAHTDTHVWYIQSNRLGSRVRDTASARSTAATATPSTQRRWLLHGRRPYRQSAARKFFSRARQMRNEQKTHLKNNRQSCIAVKLAYHLLISFHLIEIVFFSVVTSLLCVRFFVSSVFFVVDIIATSSAYLKIMSLES